ncbi:MAG: hypothetical protein K8S54_14670 [Spirochaetia bacterium]|nr:hypothetical protein [Spirochaetia bacterium]
MSICTLAGCAKQPASPLRLAYYYWQTSVDWKTSDSQFLSDTKASRIYLRLFDVELKGTEPVPVGILRVSLLPQNVEIVPVVYIKEEVFRNLDGLRSQELATNIAKQSKSILGRDFTEFQLDCDWTQGTRETYFEFISRLRKELPSNVTISATIRLHQIKYRIKTGVPPVDRGALMFYGTGSPSDPRENNSILDLKVAREYLGNLEEYPLPLDAALPVYSWGVLFHGQRFRGILRDISPELLNANLSRSGNVYRAKQTVRLRGISLSPGDWIRLESVGPDVSGEALKMVLPGLRADSRVILFHYHEGLTKYGAKEILSITDGGRALLGR